MRKHCMMLLLIMSMFLPSCESSDLFIPSMPYGTTGMYVHLRHRIQMNPPFQGFHRKAPKEMEGRMTGDHTEGIPISIAILLFFTVKHIWKAQHPYSAR